MFNKKIVIRKTENIDVELQNLNRDLEISGLHERDKIFILSQIEINFLSIKNKLELDNLKNIFSESIISGNDYNIKIILDTRKPSFIRNFFKN